MTNTIILENIKHIWNLKMGNNYFVHQLAKVHTQSIGNSTEIWQFTVVLEKAKIGSNCNINCHCFIENDVVLGDNVTVKSGVYLWDGVRVGNNSFIGPNVTFINDKYPVSKQLPNYFLETIIEDNVSIGAGATIMGGIKIGKGSIIGAASFLNRDVPPNTLWFGHPAKYIRDLD